MYEVSYYSLEDERIMEDAWIFISEQLKNLNMDVDPNLAVQVSHALELPFHWRMLRLKARWFIGVYERSGDANPILLEFVKLDLNILQGLRQEELREMSR